MADGAVQTVELAVVTRGAVPHGAVTHARHKIDRLIRRAGLPVLFGRVELLHHENPAVERPAVVKVTLDVAGRLLRAHRAAPSFREAVDLTEERLAERIRHLHERRQTHGQPAPEPGGWRHAAPPTVRPAFFPRPPQERQVMRRKALPLGERTADEAAYDMELLDHDFHLFRELGVAGDSLLVRDNGRYRMLRTGDEAVPELDAEEAVEWIEAAGDRFVFFRDRATGRGQALYRRYDGHYGLIEPAAEPGG